MTFPVLIGVEILLRPHSLHFDQWALFTSARATPLHVFPPSGSAVSISKATTPQLFAVGRIWTYRGLPNRLDFNDRLELVAFLTVPHGETPPQLDIAGADLRIENVAEPRDGGSDIWAVLPGRI